MSISFIQSLVTYNLKAVIFVVSILKKTKVSVYSLTVFQSYEGVTFYSSAVVQSLLGHDKLASYLSSLP